MAETIIDPVPGQSPPADSTAEAVRAGGERMLADAKAKVLDAAEIQRRRAADAVRGMAGTLHRVASDLKPENETMGRYTDMAAERLDQFAGYLRGTHWSDVLTEAEDLARRQPAWVVGGAMVAGFVLARAIKNAGEPRRRDEGYARRASRVLPVTSPVTSNVGYGTSTEAGLTPATPATSHPIGSVPGSGEI